MGCNSSKEGEVAQGEVEETHSPGVNAVRTHHEHGFHHDAKGRWQENARKRKEERRQRRKKRQEEGCGCSPYNSDLDLSTSDWSDSGINDERSSTDHSGDEHSTSATQVSTQHHSGSTGVVKATSAGAFEMADDENECAPEIFVFPTELVGNEQEETTYKNPEQLQAKGAAAGNPLALLPSTGTSDSFTAPSLVGEHSHTMVFLSKEEEEGHEGGGERQAGAIANSEFKPDNSPLVTEVASSVAPPQLALPRTSLQNDGSSSTTEEQTSLGTSSHQRQSSTSSGGEGSKNPLLPTSVAFVELLPTPKGGVGGARGDSPQALGSRSGSCSGSCSRIMPRTPDGKTSFFFPPSRPHIGRESLTESGLEISAVQSPETSGTSAMGVLGSSMLGKGIQQQINLAYAEMVSPEDGLASGPLSQRSGAHLHTMGMDSSTSRGDDSPGRSPGSEHANQWNCSSGPQVLSGVFSAGDYQMIASGEHRQNQKGSPQPGDSPLLVHQHDHGFSFISGSARPPVPELGGGGGAKSARGGLTVDVDGEDEGVSSRSGTASVLDQSVADQLCLPTPTYSLIAGASVSPRDALRGPGAPLSLSP